MGRSPHGKRRVSPPSKPGLRSIGRLEGNPGKAASAGALVAIGKDM